LVYTRCRSMEKKNGFKLDTWHMHKGWIKDKQVNGLVIFKNKLMELYFVGDFQWLCLKSPQIILVHNITIESLL
jgi:hypothetical protein